MNNRIKELATQAGIGYHGESLTIIQDELPETVLSRFAELVVKECAEVLDKTVSPPSHPWNSMGYKLKEYFGVNK